jgi:hypothetical protein
MQTSQLPAHIFRAVIAGDRKTLVAAGRKGGRASAEKRRQQKIVEEEQEAEETRKRHALWMKDVKLPSDQAHLEDCPLPD